MQTFVTLGHASHRLDGEFDPPSAPSAAVQSQEAFEHEHAKRAFFRAIGEASPVILVLMLLLVFSLIY